MHRANVVLWPSYSHTPTFVVIPGTFAVIEHTVTVRDPLKEDYEDEQSDEEVTDDA
jgi:hypothetical protein